jgi:hypothetical protein
VETTFNLPLFMNRLAETIAWCNYRLAQDATPESLRKVLPKPEPYGTFSESEEFLEFASGLFVTRSHLIQSSGLLLPSPEEIRQYEGRLLIFLPDCAFASDGVAELASDGFFDFMEYPPWDTWIYAVDEPVIGSGSPEKPEWLPGTELVSLVPPQFVKKVQSAIESTADQAIFWIEDLEFPTPYKIALQNAGLL